MFSQLGRNLSFNNEKLLRLNFHELIYFTFNCCRILSKIHLNPHPQGQTNKQETIRVLTPKIFLWMMSMRFFKAHLFVCFFFCEREAFTNSTEIHVLLWFFFLDFVTTPDSSPSPCDADQFLCSNGSCIHFSMVCDGELDCPDSSDEQFCDEHGKKIKHSFFIRQTISIGEPLLV